MTLQALTWACMEAGDLDAAREAAQEALALMRDAGLSAWQSRIGANLAHVAIRAGDLDAAWRHAEQAVAAARATSDTWVLIAVTQLLSGIAAQRDDLRSARDLSLSLLDAVTEVGSDSALASVHADVARYALLDGDFAVADGHAARAVELLAHSTNAPTLVFHIAGETALANGDARRAWELQLRAGRSSGITRSASAETEILASVVEGLAAVRLAMDDMDGAALLLGSAAAARGPQTGARLPREVDRVTNVVSAVRAALGDAAFDAAWSAGGLLPIMGAFATAEKMQPPA